MFARLFGVHVSEFKLGLGKEIYKKKFQKTLFSFHLIPISAHVYIDDKQFSKIHLLKKIIVILAGPLINLLLAFILIFLFLITAGQPSTPPVFAGIEINSPADKAGLKTNDKIIAINGQYVSRYEDILKTTKNSPNKKISLKIDRNSRIFDVEIVPELASYINNKGVKKTHGRLGVLARHTFYDFSIIEEINGVKIEDDSFENVKNILSRNFDQEIIIGLDSVDKEIHFYKTYLSEDLNKQYFIDDDQDRFVLGHIGNNFYQELRFSDALTKAVQHNIKTLHTIVTIPAQIFPIDTENFAPKGIVHDGKFDILRKIYKFSFILAFISIVVAVINMLPIGYLDGGRIMILLIEKATNKEITAKQIASMSFLFMMSLYLIIISMNYSKFSIYVNHIYEETTDFFS